MNVNGLVIETTRRCNVSCSHCLRGNSQPISMKYGYLHSLLSQVNHIGCITFTGGEPTLPSGLRVIEWFINYHYTPNVDNFYIVTNGKHRRSKLPYLLNRLWHLCGDNEISGVDISNDVYHDNCEHNFVYWLEEVMLYEYGIELPVHERECYSVVQEGRASDWGIRENEPEEIIWQYVDAEMQDKIEIKEGNLYLNCKGEIIAGCDWS